MYNKVDPGMNFVGREKEVALFWKKERIFEKTVEEAEGAPEFCFYDGPPTANGKPHVGHILSRAMKDCIPRFRTMQGFHVRRQAGWDTHGLPVELEVEKALKLDGKQDIERYGVEPFIKQCKESVWKYQSEWERMTARVGYWVDMEHPYVTYDDHYIESVWWSLKTIFDKGLIYRGHKIVPYCPRCGTALSSHEVAQGYKDVKEKSAVAAFQLVDAQDTYFLAWTTTPWTLPANVALCVNAGETYQTVESGGTRYILAKALVSKFFEEYTVVSECMGKDLEYQKYRPLFDFAANEIREKAWFVTCDDYVTLTDGTGIVHIAPAFGEDDARVGGKYGLPFLQPVDERGRMKPETGAFAGIFCKDADKLILADLRGRGLLFKTLEFEHSYPFCWRCDTPLIYYARKSWFIRMSSVREQLLENNATVNWLPPAIGEGRFGNFLENVIDWGLSRDRYWGTPLPIWVCEDCGHTHAVGSKQELKELGGLTEAVELHKPYVDAVTIACPKCGKTMRRTPEVIDCWYDSGSMPFAQLHYPFENKELFDKTFPADFISEGVDQTRGWFYTLMAIGTLLFEKSPYKNCLVLGHVGDKNGEKMSKHKGNVVDPWSILDVQGADAVRWYFYTASSPWLPSRFYAEAVAETQRKFLGTLWNTYSFFVQYAEIDGYNPAKHDFEKAKLTLMDRWILSELHALTDFVTQSMTEYRITEAARAAAEFVDKLSNWYVRRGRERYWANAWSADKEAAYGTLYTVLVTLCKVLAPFVPFITETIYQNLVVPFFQGSPRSVHLCKYPTADVARIDAQLNVRMERVIDIVTAARSIRSAQNLKNRQPLSRMFVAMGGETLHSEYLKIAAEEVNVQEVELIRDAGEFIRYELKPQLKTLGPKYGKLLGGIRALLGEKPDEVMAAIKSGGRFETETGGQPITLREEDLLIAVHAKEGFTSESFNGVTVILDTGLTPELIELGLVREVISKVQSMRKEFGLVVTDRIRLAAKDLPSDIRNAINAHRDEICRVTLAESLTFDTALAFEKTWELGAEFVTLSLSKVAK